MAQYYSLVFYLLHYARIVVCCIFFNKRCHIILHPHVTSLTFLDGIGPAIMGLEAPEQVSRLADREDGLVARGAGVDAAAGGHGGGEAEGGLAQGDVLPGLEDGNVDGGVKTTLHIIILTAQFGASPPSRIADFNQLSWKTITIKQSIQKL